MNIHPNVPSRVAPVWPLHVARGDSPAATRCCHHALLVLVTAALRAQARRETAPPLLNPASRDPLVFDFRETSLQDLIDIIGDATGINVSYDEQFQDREVTIRIDGLTLEETLDHVLKEVDLARATWYARLQASNATYQKR